MTTSLSAPERAESGKAGADKRPGYGQYCPISRALEVLGERWSLLIVRDMLVGATRFNDLARGLPGLSRSLLAKPLRQLETAGIVDWVDGSYLLTEAGRELMPIVFGIGEWGARWAFDDPDPAELDPELLVWWMHNRIDTSDLPGVRNVLHIRFTDDPRPFWIVVDIQGASVCKTDPGFAVDATVISDVNTLYRVWLGRVSMRLAIKNGDLELQGARAWTTRVAKIFQLSPAASLVTAAS